MRNALLMAVLVFASTLPAYAGEMKIAVLPTQFDKSSQGMVPKLFDEYVLAAVQNSGDYEVIGQDDIAALIGFEQQKDILGCDDASCIANIGGALGVDRVIAVKIARLDTDWVVTSKLINIRSTRVEARTSDMIEGNVKALLGAVPAIVDKLFATAQGTPPPAVAARSEGPRARTEAPTSRPPAARPAPAAAVSPEAAMLPDESYGRGARITGVILTLSGVGCTALSLLYGSMIDDSEYDYDYYTGDETYTESNNAEMVGGFLGASCLVLTGVGSGLYLNGRARATVANGEATGHVWYRWMGWVMLGVSAVAPFTQDDSSSTLGVSAASLGVTTLLFAMSMKSSSAYASLHGRETPLAGVSLMRYGDRTIPALAFTSTF